eukprot:TRINITY_DN4787_c0_g1_i4.p5 TRINITY_DN4787_c0_g1~~TRINITY_DN4787_c0_g1_i4.p5  ORF type:complete len:107 (+),score=0.87 TRINITY_DN4787_c0_g1_i4:310-630(+)
MQTVSIQFIHLKVYQHINKLTIKNITFLPIQQYTNQSVNRVQPQLGLFSETLRRSTNFEDSTTHNFQKSNNDEKFGKKLTFQLAQEMDFFQRPNPDIPKEKKTHHH